METPISKSQKRAISLLGLTSVDTYQVAADALDAAGYRKDAVPMGSNWRQAAKLSNSDLLAAIALPADRFEDNSNDLWY